MPIPDTVGAFAIIPHNDLAGAIPSGNVWALRAPGAMLTMRS
jgi:hypothetical protein